MSNVWRGVDEVPTDLGPTVVTIGVFDGVHRGHRVIVDRALAAARTAGATDAANRLPVVVVTFDPHPSEVVRPGTHPAMLSTLEHRVELLHAAGADDVLVLHFSASLARLTPEEFVRDVLVDRLHAVSVVVGANFRFGHRAVGTVDTLAELGKSLGFEVVAVGLVGEGERRAGPRRTSASASPRATPRRRWRCSADRTASRAWSSTATTAVASSATRRPTCTSAGTLPCPADGVYAGWLIRPSGERLPAAISIGTNPTFDGSERRVEAYCLDRTGLDLYGERVALDFGPRLRGDAQVRRRRRARRADVRRRGAGQGPHRWLGAPPPAADTLEGAVERPRNQRARVDQPRCAAQREPEGEPCRSTPPPRSRSWPSYATVEGDTGPPRSRSRCSPSASRELTEHLKTHKHDHHSRRGLLLLVGRRRRLLQVPAKPRTSTATARSSSVSACAASMPRAARSAPPAPPHPGAGVRRPDPSAATVGPR